MSAELPIEDIPAQMVGFFQRKKVNQDVLDRLSKTLRSAVPLLKFYALQQPTDLAEEKRYLHLYHVVFKLRLQMDIIGDNDEVTELQYSELEEVIREMEEHLETFDNRQNYDAVYPITYSTRLDLWEIKEFIGGGRFGIAHRGLNRKTGESCAIKEILDIDDAGVAESLDRKKWDSIFTSFICSNTFIYNPSYALDIKPHNILVDSENNIKLADFGLAKQLAESAGDHSLSGTICYTAPEVIEHGAYNSSGEASTADIWSLGFVVIEMFTGKHPWPDCSLP
ncbi:serine/threonine-protein kinase AtPK2/AtPK19-like [Neltuma alba]|uniref:serine/threonine-protein kinase AtPK2/AtPK19-like n=1 Tax=Neltuma alba TaxID=207710 RepID=UPI0010A3C728|nr:serine/threonine-protein kinase AtPK2/AtPK19-like [Prosopis alba]